MTASASQTAHHAHDPAGNAKHQAALAAQAEQLLTLRADIADTLVVLVEQTHQLEALTDSRQRLRARLVTEETRAMIDKQTRLDRAAARGLVDRVTDTGLTWMNHPARIGTGQVAAPVQTMPALSVVAEIRHTLRHHIRRLGRPAKLALLEAEQTLVEDHGICAWPRHPLSAHLTTTTVDTTDHGIAHLAARLLRLVEAYTNRRDLDALKRDLDRLEEAALDITHGMPGRSALPIGSETCPHCGRNTLALLSRVDGVKALVVRCEGTHRCECTWEFCECHRNPRRNRHEWINSGSAAHTFHELHNLQTKRKELAILETKALDAIDVIRGLHQPVPLYRPASDCADPDGHSPLGYDDLGNPGEQYCTHCPPAQHVCSTCGSLTTTDAFVPYPCATAVACAVDDTRTPDQPDTTE